MLERINKLRRDSPAQWGKMNVAQMLAHSQIPLEVPLGKHQLPKMFIMRIFGPSIKKMFMADKPVKRNQPTAKSMRITNPKDFEQEKAGLIKILKEFSEVGKVGKLPDRHPYFGKFTTEEWNTMQVKHLDHHLTQFGV